ncbi:MAG: pyridoxine 5'-phosphate synthase [Succinivibrio sp.]
MKPIYLGVNIDHVATVRNARGTDYPDPVAAAAIAELAGADSITTHLREDRRHITDRDVRIIRETAKTALNLEMAVTDEIVSIAVALAPQKVCMVPERREEVTTEGGLDVVGNMAKIENAVSKISKVGTVCSLFIDPVKEQIDAAVKVGAPFVEFHTGRYANAKNEQELQHELQILTEMAAYADEAGLGVNSGHGLNYNNVAAIAAIPQMNELNIGHSIIARAIFTGLPEAVKTMKEIMEKARFNLAK